MKCQILMDVLRCCVFRMRVRTYYVGWMGWLRRRYAGGNAPGGPNSIKCSSGFKLFSNFTSVPEMLGDQQAINPAMMVGDIEGTTPFKVSGF